MCSRAILARKKMDMAEGSATGSSWCQASLGNMLWYSARNDIFKVLGAQFLGTFLHPKARCIYLRCNPRKSLDVLNCFIMAVMIVESTPLDKNAPLEHR
jgi:hypothetical protein